MQIQTHILRVITEIMIFVDGMGELMKRNVAVQWMYSLLASTYKRVQEIALKLLIVFLEYAETNSGMHKVL